MQFMNSSLDALVKNLSDNGFKFLSEVFCGGFLKLVKQKGAYPYEYMDSFKTFSDDKLLDRCKFFSSLKGECISKKIIYTLVMFGLCFIISIKTLLLLSFYYWLMFLKSLFVNSF